VVGIKVERERERGKKKGKQKCTKIGHSGA
jgi:hypothetical protein